MSIPFLIAEADLYDKHLHIYHIMGAYTTWTRVMTEKRLFLVFTLDCSAGPYKPT